MNDKVTDNQFPQQGTRKAPEREELLGFLRESEREGGSKRIPAAAKRFAGSFAATLTHYPKRRELPKWLRAMVAKNAPVEELAKTLHDRLLRAPSEENMELALIMANEIARLDGGPAVLNRYVTPELLARLSGEGGKER
jgi:hypothetical protein